MGHTGEVSQYPQPYPQPYYQPAVAPEPSLPWARALSVTVAVFLVVGAIGGWVWQQYAPLARYSVDADGGSLGEEEMTRVFGPDGTFTAIGFIAGLVIGGALFWWLHRYGPWAVAIVVAGSALGSGVAWGVGMLLGHDPLDPRLEAAKPGDLLPAPLELHGWTPSHPGSSGQLWSPPLSRPRPGGMIRPRLQPDRPHLRPSRRRGCTNLTRPGDRPDDPRGLDV